VAQCPGGRSQPVQVGFNDGDDTADDGNRLRGGFESVLCRLAFDASRELASGALTGSGHLNSGNARHRISITNFDGNHCPGQNGAELAALSGQSCWPNRRVSTGERLWDWSA
jgi:hypothetical protein